MCGIAGLLELDRDRPAEEGLLTRMTRVLEHRGPDGEGFFREGPVGLGHRRLSIIDLEGGAQPMLTEDGKTALVFNGEVYNFMETRALLEEKGHAFKTRCDTEVILRAYVEWGERCVEHFRGMFTFAIWDGHKQELFLARDRLGIKPLYYGRSGKRFLFGSEIKSIVEDATFDRALDPTALDDYMTYMYIPAPKSVFANVRKLRPGHTLTVKADGTAQEREYWDLEFSPQQRSLEEHTEGLREQLDDAVKARLVSDVPLGAFLSGGIDSSAVVGTMAGLIDRPVATASIGFSDAQFDELQYARQIAEKFGTDPYEKVVDADAAGILDKLCWYYDEPFADSSMVPTYYVSQVARERVTVALSGDGGDENFAGYRRYRFDVFENRLRGLMPGALRRPLFGALGAVYPKADWLPQMFRAKTLLTNLSLTPSRGYFHSMSWLKPAMKQKLYTGPLSGINGYDPAGVLDEHFQKVRDLDPLTRIQYVDMKTYLVDDILTKVDRASMAHSLEVRVPILDHKFMEYAATIPSGLKLHDGEGKYVFKKALEPLLPHDTLYRKKMGFSIPLARWFRDGLKTAFEQRVLAKDAFVQNLLQPAGVKDMWQQHQSGVRDYAYELWAILVLESWGRRFLENRI